MTVYIHPGVDPFYFSFYLKGLAETFGPRALRYSRSKFPLHGRQLAFRLTTPELNVYIDARDGAQYDTAALAWCDVYGKVNADASAPSGHNTHKVVSIGPSFGIRLWSLPTAAFYAVYSVVQRRATDRRSLREHFANYWRQWRYRLPEEAYAPKPSEGDYIFFVSSLWKGEPACNQYRANFIEACEAIDGIYFEGGFAPRAHNDVPGFEQHMLAQRFSLTDYIAKLQRSAVAFNTPAVGGCHGWKLAEFLSLGKAIVSTPLTRLLPAPLVHGEHLHVVDSSVSSIKDAVEKIARDEAYRRRLESNARRYYLEYLQPRRVIERMLFDTSPSCTLPIASRTRTTPR